MADSSDTPVGPPIVDDLVALPPAAWTHLVAHARRVLQDLPPEETTPVVQRVRAAPVKRLRSGRSRKDLADVIAAGGTAWRELADRLRADQDLPEVLSFLLTGERADLSDVPAPRPQPQASTEDRDDKARERAKRLKQERDEARRQVDGMQARMAGAAEKVTVLEARVGELETELTKVRQELATAADERERAIAREQRRQESTVAQLKDEVATLRREAQERFEADKDKALRDERAAAALAEQRRADAEQERIRRAGSADLAAPGRPSELPPGVAEGTTAHATALLARGRRVLVDGYNVTKTLRPDFKSEADERHWLEQGCRALVAARLVRLELFWDGEGAEPTGPTLAGGIAVSFSRAGVDADDDIVFAVASAEADEPLVVVTDDRGLRERLAEYDVDLLPTRAFGWALRG